MIRAHYLKKNLFFDLITYLPYFVRILFNSDSIDFLYIFRFFNVLDIYKKLEEFL